MEQGKTRRSTRRCVVWHQPGVAPRAELLNALESRGLRVETTPSGHEVLAMGCREQQRLDQGATGLIVVLDAGDQRFDDQQRVLEAMERFSPSVLVWVYQVGANPPLSAFVQKREPTIGSMVRPQDSKPETSSPPPTLRLAGTNGQGPTKTTPQRASDVLDQDELAALLKPNNG